MKVYKTKSNNKYYRSKLNKKLSECSHASMRTFQYNKKYVKVYAIRKILNRYIGFTKEEVEKRINKELSLYKTEAYNSIRACYEYENNRLKEKEYVTRQYTPDRPYVYKFYSLKKSHKIFYDFFDSDDNQIGYMKGSIYVGKHDVYVPEINDILKLKLYNCRCMVFNDYGGYHYPNDDNMISILSDVKIYDISSKTNMSLILYTHKNHYLNEIGRYNKRIF